MTLWQRMEDVICLLWPDTLLFPYGSYAVPGMMTPDSDVDVMVSHAEVARVPVSLRQFWKPGCICFVAVNETKRLVFVQIPGVDTSYFEFHPALSFGGLSGSSRRSARVQGIMSVSRNCGRSTTPAGESHGERWRHAQQNTRACGPLAKARENTSLSSIVSPSACRGDHRRQRPMVSLQHVPGLRNSTLFFEHAAKSSILSRRTYYRL